MRLRFGPDDGDAFFAARNELVSRFGAWPGRGNIDPEDAGLLLDAKYSWGNGDLGTWTLDDLDEVLLSWFPAKVAMPPEMAPAVTASTRAFFRFLAAERLLSRSSAPAAALDAHLRRIEPAFAAAMGDRSRFGMAKSLLTGIEDEFDLDLDDADGVQRLMDHVNSLPFEERGRLLGILDEVDDDSDGSWLDGIELPPARSRTDPEMVAAVDAHALTNDIEAIRAFLGKGRKLTAKGNLTVADAKALAQQLGVDPLHFEGETAERFPVRSADNLPDLQFRLRLARAAGATRVAKGTLSATASWRKRSRIDAVEKVVTTLLDEGPLELRRSPGTWGFGLVDELVDEGADHVVAALWSRSGEPVPYDELAAMTETACLSQLGWPAHVREEHMRLNVRSSFDLEMRLLEEAGLVVRTGYERRTSSYGTEKREGGELTLTPLGQSLLADHLRSAGFVVPEVGRLTTATLAAVLDTVDEWHPDRTDAEFDAWTEANGTERAIADLTGLAGTTDPFRRLTLIRLAARLPAPADETAMRGLLATPIAGHAALWLQQHGREEVDLPRDVMLLAGVDLFACQLDDPTTFIETFAGIDDPDGFIDEIWRVRDPAAGDVLATIGKHHPDARVAKLARKAVIRHRSHLANLR